MSDKPWRTVEPQLLSCAAARLESIAEPIRLHQVETERLEVLTKFLASVPSIHSGLSGIYESDAPGLKRAILEASLEAAFAVARIARGSSAKTTPI